MRFFERLVPALDLALGLWMVRRSTRVGEALFGQPVGKLFRYVRRPIVREDTRPLSDFDLIEPRGLQGEVQGFLRIDRSHVGAKLPADDIARDIISGFFRVNMPYPCP